MTKKERHDKLKELLSWPEIQDRDVYSGFGKWQGRVFALLSFNPTLQTDFRGAVASVFGHETEPQVVRKASGIIHSVISQAIEQLAQPEDDSAPNGKVIVGETKPIELTHDQDISWFVYHCTYRVKIKIIIT